MKVKHLFDVDLKKDLVAVGLGVVVGIFGIGMSAYKTGPDKPNILRYLFPMGAYFFDRFFKKA